jgi:hypothetical protein
MVGKDNSVPKEPSLVSDYNTETMDEIKNKYSQASFHRLTIEVIGVMDDKDKQAKVTTELQTAKENIKGPAVNKMKKYVTKMDTEGKWGSKRSHQYKSELKIRIKNDKDIKREFGNHWMSVSRTVIKDMQLPSVAGGGGSCGAYLFAAIIICVVFLIYSFYIMMSRAYVGAPTQSSCHRAAAAQMYYPQPNSGQWVGPSSISPTLTRY